MLDILQSGERVINGQTIFKLSDFESVSSIRDNGPYNVPLTKNNLFVGENEHGKYIDFRGGSTNMSFSDVNLDCEEAEILLTVSNIEYINAQYRGAILDTRPITTNGNYFIFGVQTNISNDKPRAIIGYARNISFDSGDIKFIDQYRKIKIQILKEKIVYYFDDVKVYESPYTLPNFRGQRFKLGLSAFSGAVPTGIFKLYDFEIKKIS